MPWPARGIAVWRSISCSGLTPAAGPKLNAVALQRLQDALGALNDMDVHARLLRSLAPSDRKTALAAGILVGWENARREVFFKRARNAARQFRRAPALC
jgi:CHAD domain-containing protein